MSFREDVFAKILTYITVAVLLGAMLVEAFVIYMERREQDLVLSWVNTVRSDGARQDSSGIGLSNMRAMMEKMGGRLEAEQEDGLFRVSLYFPAQ